MSAHVNDSKFSLKIHFFRCKKVYDGVSHAAKLYPAAYLIMIIIGTLKGKKCSFDFFQFFIVIFYNEINKLKMSLKF